MKDSKMFSSDYIYETIFSLSEDKYNEERDLVREDSKRTFRLGQLEAEGNDPAKSGRSYGTPHDLASMYGRRATATEKDLVMFLQDTENQDQKAVDLKKKLLYMALMMTQWVEEID